MNIEEARSKLISFIDFYNKKSKEENRKFKMLQVDNIDIKAIETLLTAYEKEKEKNESLIKERATEIVYVDKNFVRKDKIKAKTIEIKNRPVKDEFITASQGKLNTIIDMESLLEKE